MEARILAGLPVHGKLSKNHMHNKGFAFRRTRDTIRNLRRYPVNCTETPMDMDENELRTRLEAMQVEHRDLDQVISHLIVAPPPDELLMRRLKKRKLLLKDRISQVERLLEPDEPA